MMQLNNRLMPQDYEASYENVVSLYLKKHVGQQEDPDPPASPGNKHRLLKLLLLICAVLVAAIIFLTVYHFSKLNDKQQDLEEIKNAYYNLTSNYSTLLKTHAILQSQYTKNYSALVESQAALETQCLRNYSALQESRATLEIHWTRNHSALMKSHATLQSQCEILKKDHAELLAWNRKLKKCNNPVINMTRENVSCPEGWLLFDLKCYFFSTDIKTWQLSQEQCMSMGGHLVIIESMEEENFLEDKANILTGENYGYWIGLTDLEKEGQFVWVDSRPLDPKYRFWERTEPNGGQKENCVQMWLISQWKRWHDFPCVTEARRICEAIATLLPI